MSAALDVADEPGGRRRGREGGRRPPCGGRRLARASPLDRSPTRARRYRGGCGRTRAPSPRTAEPLACSRRSRRRDHDCGGRPAPDRARDRGTLDTLIRPMLKSASAMAAPGCLRRLAAACRRHALALTRTDELPCAFALRRRVGHGTTRSRHDLTPLIRWGAVSESRLRSESRRGRRSSAAGSRRDTRRGRGPPPSRHAMVMARSRYSTSITWRPPYEPQLPHTRLGSSPRTVGHLERAGADTLSWIACVTVFARGSCASTAIACSTCWLRGRGGECSPPGIGGAPSSGGRESGVGTQHHGDSGRGVVTLDAARRSPAPRVTPECSGELVALDGRWSPRRVRFVRSATPTVRSAARPRSRFTASHRRAARPAYYASGTRSLTSRGRTGSTMRATEVPRRQGGLRCRTAPPGCVQESSTSFVSLMIRPASTETGALRYRRNPGDEGMRVRPVRAGERDSSRRIVRTARPRARTARPC